MFGHDEDWTLTVTSLEKLIGFTERVTGFAVPPMDPRKLTDVAAGPSRVKPDVTCGAGGLGEDGVGAAGAGVLAETTGGH